MRDWRDKNGFSEKGPRAAGKGIQDLASAGSNPETPPANENPGGHATGAMQFDQWIKSRASISDSETATALCHAILDCEPSDACEIMAVAYADLSIGMPIAPLIGLMDEARFWAEMATTAELKAYCLACFSRLPASEQSAFLAYIQQSRAA